MYIKMGGGGGDDNWATSILQYWQRRTFTRVERGEKEELVHVLANSSPLVRTPAHVECMICGAVIAILRYYA